MATHTGIHERIEQAAEAAGNPMHVPRSLRLSSRQLAEIAETLHADVYWLITGEPDPLAVHFTTCAKRPHTPKPLYAG